MLLFLISALRAVVEMLGLCLMAQGTLRLIAARSYASNPIYQFFALITRPPRTLVKLLTAQRLGPIGVSMLTFFLLLLFWLGLAILRKFI